jgi:hypothetical protein
MPQPRIVAYPARPRASAWSARSTTNTPAPSASTSPLRRRSKGRLAWLGSSQPRARARALPNVSASVGNSGASEHPQTTASASPARSSRTASAIDCAPAAHAVPMDEL